MRKLLVASQKGGVGKTTTSINLAAATALAGARVLLLDADPLSSISNSLGLGGHPNRKPLRDHGLDLPGVLVNDLVPGLDVLSPYEDGGCSDDELDYLLALLASPELRECYGCLVVDTPPFLGASPGQLLGTCDEFVLVMRAEAMASRTLPAFLELVQRSKKPIKMGGILLTLAETDEPGGRWERELRGRFGTRILPHVVPHDEAVCQAGLFQQIASHATPEAPASRAYHALVESLCLASSVWEQKERPGGIDALLLAAATRKNMAPANAPTRKVRPAPAAVTAPIAPPAAPPPVIAAPAVHEPDFETMPEPVRRRLTPVTPLPVAPRAEPPAAPPAKPKSAPRRAVPPPARAEGFGAWVGVLGVMAAVALGVGLRFLRLPEGVLPMLAGVGVAGAVLLVVLLLQRQEEPRPRPPARKGPRAAGDSARRLSDLARRAKEPAGRESEAR